MSRKSSNVKKMLGVASSVTVKKQTGNHPTQNAPTGSRNPAPAIKSGAKGKAGGMAC